MYICDAEASSCHISAPLQRPAWHLRMVQARVARTAYNFGGLGKYLSTELLQRFARVGWFDLVSLARFT